MASRQPISPHLRFKRKRTAIGPEQEVEAKKDWSFCNLGPGPIFET